MESEHIETRSQEFARLVNECEATIGHKREEVLGLIADFSVENAKFIRDALLDYVAPTPDPAPCLEAIAAAIRTRRRELIAQPLDRIYGELALAALKAMQGGDDGK